MKRILFTIIILIASIFVLAYLYFTQLNTQRAANDLALNQVTSQSGIVFSLEYNKNSFEMINSQDLIQKLIEDEQIQTLNTLKQLSTNTEIANYFMGQQVYVGLVSKTAKQNILLITLQAKENIPDQLLSKYNFKLLNANLFQLNADSSQLFVYKKDNFLAISSDIDVLKKIDSNNPNANSFAQFIKKNSQYQKTQIANLFLDFSVLQASLNNKLKDATKGELAFIMESQNFAKLDYNFSKNQILFTGFNEFNDQKAYIKLFETQKPVKADILNILPENTSSYQVFTYHDYQKLSDKIRNWHEHNPNKKPLTNFKLIETNYALKLDEVLPLYFKNQFVTFQLKDGEKLAAIQLSNGEKVAQILLDLSTAYNTEINALKEKNIFYTFFGAPFLRFEKPFYTIIDNYIILSNYPSSLQTFLNQYKQDKTLINKPSYQHYLTQVSEANITLFWNQSKDFDAYSLQLTGDNNKFNSNYLAISKQDTTKSPSN